MMKNFRQTNLRGEGFQSLLQPWSSRSAAAQHVYARAQSAAEAQQPKQTMDNLAAHAQAAAAGNDMKGTFAVKVCASPCAPQPPGPSAWCIARVVGWLRLSGSERGPRFVARARRRASAAGSTRSWTSVELGGAVAGGMLRRVTNEPGPGWRRTQAQQADMVKPGGRRTR